MRATPRRLAATLATATALGFVAGCASDDDGRSAAAGTITVFAAASLADAFAELGDSFTAANPGTDVTFSFAASSELVAQIVEGAPADVFASADQANMAKLTDADEQASDPVVFATNLMEIVVASGNPEGITGLADLADEDLVVVTCAVEVPCGAYAEQIFVDAGVQVAPKSYEENVKAVVAKVTIGEADAGIVYRTDVAAAGDAVTGIEIPDDVNVVAEYPIVATQTAADPELAQAFVDHVLSDDGQAVLASFGFLAP